MNNSKCGSCGRQILWKMFHFSQRKKKEKKIRVGLKKQHRAKNKVNISGFETDTVEMIFRTLEPKLDTLKNMV
jgi:uncharacterized radical SAM superfamily protein